MNPNEQHDGDAAGCSSEPATPRSLDWSDMLTLACRQVGKFAVYGNYTAPLEDVESVTKAFFIWCDKLGLGMPEQGLILNDLMFGNAVLFDTSEEAGRIFRFFLEKGVPDKWFACLVSPTEGIVTENT